MPQDASGHVGRVYNKDTGVRAQGEHKMEWDAAKVRGQGARYEHILEWLRELRSQRKEKLSTAAVVLDLKLQCWGARQSPVDEQVR